MLLHICCTVNVVYFLKCKVTVCACSVCGTLKGLANAPVTLRLKYLFCIPIGTKKRHCQIYMSGNKVAFEMTECFRGHVFHLFSRNSKMLI